MTMDELIKRLETQYRFLKHIQINDDFYNEQSGDIISVMSDINTVSTNRVRKSTSFHYRFDESLSWGERGSFFHKRNTQ